MHRTTIVVFVLLAMFVVTGSNTANAQAGSGDSQSAIDITAVEGVWLGELHDGKDVLHVRLELANDDKGQCKLFSLDQGAKPLPCRHLQLKDNAFSFDVPAVKGNWKGNLSPDHNQLSGTWTQDSPLPLSFKRQATRSK